jgi:long-chain acyl-CoA synthetase
MSRLLRVEPERREQVDSSSLRSILHGAAPCPPAVKRAMIDWFGPIVTEYYGGTEGGFIARISAEEWLERPGSVGRPLEVVEVLVVDAEGRRQPPGEPGDLYFRSLLGSRFEYHNAPDKTEAAHLEPGVATLGDIGYLDDDGYLFLSDRRIDMVVSGGVNIYPAEIEAVLVGAGPVVDAAVFGVPDEDMGEAVRAAVVLRDGAVWDEATEAQVIEHCRSKLAGYKCPRSFEVDDALPRSEAGKLLKRELRDPWWADQARRI